MAKVKTSDHPAASPDNVLSLSEMRRRLMNSTPLNELREHATHLGLVKLQRERGEEEKDGKSAQLHNKRIMVGGLDVRYIEAGPADGKVILFVHGSGTADAMGWHKNMGFFAERGYRVLAPDLPGFGDTRGETGQKWTDKSHSEFIDNFLSSLNVSGKISMVGASAGGFTTIMYAASHPQKVDDIVTVGSYDPSVISTYMRPVPEILSHPRLMEYSVWVAARSNRIFHLGYKVYEFLNKGREDFNRVSDEKINQSQEQWKGMRRATFEYISEHRRQAKSYEQALQAIAASNVRVLLVHGGKDSLTFAESSRRTAELLKSTFVSFANSTHAPHRDNAREFNERVMKFLDERRQAQQEPEHEERDRWHPRLHWRRSA
jgi:epoxide hydrolase 4